MFYVWLSRQLTPYILYSNRQYFFYCFIGTLLNPHKVTNFILAHRKLCGSMISVQYENVSLQVEQSLRQHHLNALVVEIYVCNKLLDGGNQSLPLAEIDTEKRVYIALVVINNLTL